MRLEQRGTAELDRNTNEAALRAGQNTSSYETGRMVSDINEGNCEVTRRDKVILRIIVYVFLFAELSLVVLYQFYLQL